MSGKSNGSLRPGSAQSRLFHVCDVRLAPKRMKAARSMIEYQSVRTNRVDQPLSQSHQ
jgi:hypothetical protein